MQRQYGDISKDLMYPYAKQEQDKMMELIDQFNELSEDQINKKKVESIAADLAHYEGFFAEFKNFLAQRMRKLHELSPNSKIHDKFVELNALLDFKAFYDEVCLPYKQGGDVESIMAALERYKQKAIDFDKNLKEAIAPGGALVYSDAAYSEFFQETASEIGKRLSQIEKIDIYLLGFYFGFCKTVFIGWQYFQDERYLLEGEAKFFTDSSIRLMREQKSRNDLLIAHWEKRLTEPGAELSEDVIQESLNVRQRIAKILNLVDRKGAVSNDSEQKEKVSATYEKSLECISGLMWRAIKPSPRYLYMVQISELGKSFAEMEETPFSSIQLLSLLCLGLESAKDIHLGDKYDITRFNVIMGELTKIWQEALDQISKLEIQANGAHSVTARMNKNTVDRQLKILETLNEGLLQRTKVISDNFGNPEAVLPALDHIRNQIDSAESGMSQKSFHDPHERDEMSRLTKEADGILEAVNKKVETLLRNLQKCFAESSDCMYQLHTRVCDIFDRSKKETAKALAIRQDYFDKKKSVPAGYQALKQNRDRLFDIMKDVKSKRGAGATPQSQEKMAAAKEALDGFIAGLQSPGVALPSAPPAILLSPSSSSQSSQSGRSVSASGSGSTLPDSKDNDEPGMPLNTSSLIPSRVSVTPSAPPLPFSTTSSSASFSMQSSNNEPGGGALPLTTNGLLSLPALFTPSVPLSSSMPLSIASQRTPSSSSGAVLKTISSATTPPLPSAPTFSQLPLSPAISSSSSSSPHSVMSPRSSASPASKLGQTLATGDGVGAESKLVGKQQKAGWGGWFGRKKKDPSRALSTPRREQQEVVVKPAAKRAAFRRGSNDGPVG